MPFSISTPTCVPIRIIFGRPTNKYCQILVSGSPSLKVTSATQQPQRSLFKSTIDIYSVWRTERAALEEEIYFEKSPKCCLRSLFHRKERLFWAPPFGSLGSDIAMTCRWWWNSIQRQLLTISLSGDLYFSLLSSWTIASRGLYKRISGANLFERATKYSQIWTDLNNLPKVIDLNRSSGRLSGNK